MNQPKRILICPLDWGLGHATRCIPIIRLLLKKNAQVVIAAYGRPLALLKQEFPDLTYIELDGYGIEYPKSGAMIFKMAISLPKIFKGIKKEHQQLDKIIDEHKIDVVISDNRYGCWSNKVKSIFITHQLMIKAPFGEKLLHRIILKYIEKYDECWIPDVAEENNLSGDLSHKYVIPKNTYFIGALSRFSNKETNASTPLSMTQQKVSLSEVEDFYDYNNSLLTNKNQYDIMAIVSGPEPQRTIFEKMVAEQLFKSKLKALMVLGLPEGKKKIEEKGNLKMVSHLSTEEMKMAILNSKLIIARSGYSTIMDLAVLEKNAVFIPTPGQTEQEYLAEMLSSQKIIYSVNQSHFQLTEAIKLSENYSGFENFNNKNFLEERVEVLL